MNVVDGQINNLKYLIYVLKNVFIFKNKYRYSETQCYINEFNKLIYQIEFLYNNLNDMLIKLIFLMIQF